MHVYMLSAHLKLFWIQYLGYYRHEKGLKKSIGQTLDCFTSICISELHVAGELNFKTVPIYMTCICIKCYFKSCLKHDYFESFHNTFVLSDVSLDKRFQVTAWSKALVPTYSPVNNFDTRITKEVMLEFKRSSWYLVTALKLSGIPMKYFFFRKASEFQRDMVINARVQYPLSLDRIHKWNTLSDKNNNSNICSQIY